MSEYGAKNCNGAELQPAIFFHDLIDLRDWIATGLAGVTRHEATRGDHQPGSQLWAKQSLRLRRGSFCSYLWHAQADVSEGRTRLQGRNQELVGSARAKTSDNMQQPAWTAMSVTEYGAKNCNVAELQPAILFHDLVELGDSRALLTHGNLNAKPSGH